MQRIVGANQRVRTVASVFIVIFLALAPVPGAALDMGKPEPHAPGAYGR
jgi:hypothetical protein